MFTQYEIPSNDIMINLGIGQPNNKQLPIEWFNSTISNIKITDPSFLQYHAIEGYKSLLEKIKYWLEYKYYSNNSIININELFMTNGNTGALHLIMTLMMKRGDYIIIENPTYFIAKKIFEEYGLNCIYLNMEEDGFDINELEIILKKYSELFKTQNIFFYSIPIHHNPSSITLSNIKREKLKELCDKFPKFYIIADEVYHFINFDNNNYYPLAYYHENILSLGSFSKIITPALRVGWIYQKNGKIIDFFKKSSLLDSSGGINPLSYLIIEKSLENNTLDNIVENNISLLKNRCNFMINFLKNNLNEIENYEIITFNIPKGGYFCWLKLNNKLNSDNFLNFCIKNKIKFHPGYKFGENMENYIRISFSCYEIDDLKIGLNRLIESYLIYIKIYNKIKISICGHTGKLGSMIKEQILNSNKYYFLEGIDRNIFIKNVEEIDIIIDVSISTMTENLINYLIEKNINKKLIIGTTNLNENTIKKLKLYAKNNVVYVISNFSEGIHKIKEIINILNELNNEWKLSITEKHHIAKKDSPSGTAKMLESLLNKDCNIFSIREGNIIGVHDIILNTEYEEIQISHIVKNRKIFADGCIKIIDNIFKSNIENGYYFM